ncbi:unnamed protein product, partial [Didymodactylos carnosus]
TVQTNWDSWGRDDIFRQKKALSSSVSENQEQYFQDMTPTVKKPPMIILKKRETNNISNYNASRLQMMNEPAEFKSGLDEWNEDLNMPATTWDENNLEDLSQEASEALKETRRIEREKKIREHQQRKVEKDSQRSSHKRESLTLNMDER